VKWFSQDTGMFFSGSFDKTVKVWDTNAGLPVMTFSFQHSVYNIDTPRVGNVGVSGSTSLSGTATASIAAGCLLPVATEHSDIRLCDIRAKTPLHSLQGHNGTVKVVRFSPRFEYLLASASSDGGIRLWDIRRGGCLASLNQHSAPDTSVFIDNQVSITNGRQWTAKAHDGSVTSICWTPDGRSLMSAGTDNALRCWDMMSATKQLTNFGTVRNNAKTHLQMAISSDGSVVYCPQANNILSFDIGSGRMFAKLSGHFDRVHCCVSHPLTQELYSGSADGQLMVWSPTSMITEVPEDESDRDRWSDNE
jgi:DNA excision repair protein ERCC-8